MIAARPMTRVCAPHHEGTALASTEKGHARTVTKLPLQWCQPGRQPDGQLRVLHVAAEVYPQVKTGGLGDIAAALPGALRAQGADAWLLVPGYPQIMDGLRHACQVADLGACMGAARVQVLKGRLSVSDLPVYVLDAPWYFRRKGNPYLGPDHRDWPDNIQRFALLGWVAAHLAWGDIDPAWQADILHAHDWHAGLAPVYLSLNPLRRVRSVFSVHNLIYQGLFALEDAPELALPPRLLRAGSARSLEYYGKGSFMKGGLAFADWLLTVSPRYAYEITTPMGGAGMEGVLLARRDRLSGILNGIDESVWNPRTDTWLAETYDRQTLHRKVTNKLDLQEAFGLTVDPDRMLAIVVSRLTDQKGADLILQALPKMQALGIQLVLLGSGDVGLQDAFLQAAASAPDRIAVRLGYDEGLAHRLFGAGDLVLVPSRFEPCGLTQLYGLRYGTLPLVRNVGGLADTVNEHNDGYRAENGFVFQHADAADLTRALERAAALWADKEAWTSRMCIAMAAEHGWRPAASEYLALYHRLLSEPS